MSRRILTSLVLVGTSLWVVAQTGCDEETTDACEGVTCSGEGDCVVLEGEASCDCDPGYGPGPLALECSPLCGDGMTVGAETCDDGNQVSGDGCRLDCTVESGWACTGAPSTCVRTCGNGILDSPETCDDGNQADGDGCSDGCAIEPGWECTGEPSSCMTLCGDGLIEGAEACDDGNVVAGDGCGTSCTAELGWECTGMPSLCTPVPPTAIQVCADSNTDRLEACRNGLEICDDQGFIVPAGPLVIACHANTENYEGDGIGYLALNSGPTCTQADGCCPASAGANCDVSLRLYNDGAARCRGWEQCGCAGQVCPCQDAWDHLTYVSDGGGQIIVDCTAAGTVRDIDLSAQVGNTLYVGVYTQPDYTTGHMSTVCVARKTW